MTDGLTTIDHAAESARAWVNELTERLEWTSRRDVLRLLRATLTAVRDHIGHDEAAQLAAQLPVMIRGMFYEGWRPSKTPLKDRSREGFVAEIEARVGDVIDYCGPRDVAAAFAFIGDKVSAGEIEDVFVGLPKGVRELLRPERGRAPT